MFNKGNFTLLLIVFLVFVGFGDSFLPKPLSTASYNTRTTINNFAIGLFPTWKPKVNPDERTEKAIEDTERGGRK
ncbi:MAG: hypothetical protein KME64_13015 [Scytonematopsis contorta HA4267-MV1]|jgi:hypothetical protein|nr:hypothetical protein [Scytonematopsis contorta HA4267-MV1]